jgi:hypothetical protein
LSDTAHKIELIGQGGNILQTKNNTNVITYALQRKDTYVRAKIYGDSSVLWMNPIMRGNGVNSTKPTINIAQTIMYRSAWWIGYGLIIIGYFLFKRRKK